MKATATASNGGKKSAEARSLKRPVPHPETAGREYSASESEFLRAVAEYQARYRVRFMSATDYMYVLTGTLGYERPRVKQNA